ncbi:hypothetical protein BSKO_10411 [Bryopsis sp. KO-2023]|nr:hypothetical protein BSKO_10411 [Bryopsis sp. KO-2023]
MAPVPAFSLPEVLVNATERILTLPNASASTELPLPILASVGLDEEAPLTNADQRGNCSAPDAPITCLDNNVDDRELVSSLWLNALLGIVTLVSFGLLHRKMVVYKIRTVLPQVTVKPPRLPSTGWKQYSAWIYRTVLTTDQDLLASAGMDSLMLVKTMGFGVQLFFPLSVVSLCVLLPMHANGGDHKKGERKLFKSLTISNIPPGVSDFWVHFVCVYAFIGYTLLLLFYHQKRFVQLRHHYLTAGDDPNLWRVKYQSHAPRLNRSMSIANTAFQFKQFIKRATGIEEEELGAVINRPSGLLSQAAKSQNAAGAQKIMDELKSRGVTPDGGGTPRSVGTPIGRSPFGGGPNTSNPGTPRERKSADAGGPRVSISDHQQENQPLATNTSVTSIAEVGIEENGAEGDGNEHQRLRVDTLLNFPMPIHSTSSLGDKTVLKWWAVDGDNCVGEDGLPTHSAKRGVHTARPSVRFLKTVNTEDLMEGEAVAVNAQQYCVLITDVPDLEGLLRKKDKPENSGVRKMIIDCWTWMSGAVSLKDINPRDARTKSAIDPDVLRKYGTGVQRSSRLDTSTHSSMHSSGTLGPLGGQTARNPLKSASSKWGVVAEKVRTQEIFNLEECVVADSFRSLFPHDFVRAHPIRVQKEIDLLLVKWEGLAAKLEELEYDVAATGQTPLVRSYKKWWSFLTCNSLGKGPKVKAIPHYQGLLRDIEDEIVATRKKILREKPSSTWLLIFRTQYAATIAAQSLLHSESGHKFQAHAAPGPEEMNWQALWKTWVQKDIRRVLVFPWLVGLIIFPLGIFAGGLSKLSEVLCDPDGDSYVGEGYCKDTGRLWSPQKLITGWLPPVLVSLWQNMVMPNLLYMLVQMQASCISLSQLDQEIASLFFYWDVINIFTGGMVGGTILSKLDVIVNGGESITQLLGEALPTSSNFFINYVVLRAFFLVPYQLMLPHPGVWQYLLRFGGKIGTKTARAKALLMKSCSIRYGREYGIVMLIFLIALAYSVTAPIIVPLALVFFMTSWLTWRYQVLYVFVRKYESGGKMWPFVFNRMLWILWLFQVFTSCILTVKQAFWEAAILWVTVPIILLRFWRYCEARFKSGMEHIPLEMAHLAPPAVVDPKVYTPPALIQGCAGWHPEYMKAWEGWNAPGYTW